MLVEMAIGDSFGAGFEFVTPIEQSAHNMINDASRYYQHPVLAIGNGRYTDDTQMALAISELLIAKETCSYIAMVESLPEKFVSTFKRDERLGYGSKFYEILKSVNSGTELVEKLDPVSTRSGAAMRAGPVGLYGDLRMVLTAANRQAAITHNSPNGIRAAQAVAMMTHYFVHEENPQNQNVGQRIADHFSDYPWDKDWEGWVSVEGMDCAHAAITAVKNGKSYRDVLERCIAFGGDVDTVAAIAMFATSLTDLPNDLPIELYEDLENGTYGRDYLATVDIQLKEFAKSQGAKLF